LPSGLQLGWPKRAPAGAASFTSLPVAMSFTVIEV
jgi:hypothetical protein